jgi:hypothetical protein
MPKSEVSVCFLPLNAKKPGKVVTGFFFLVRIFYNLLLHIDYIFVKLEV